MQFDTNRCTIMSLPCMNAHSSCWTKCLVSGWTISPCWQHFPSSQKPEEHLTVLCVPCLLRNMPASGIFIYSLLKPQVEKLPFAFTVATSRYVSFSCGLMRVIDMACVISWNPLLSKTTLKALSNSSITTKQHLNLYLSSMIPNLNRLVANHTINYGSNYVN